MPAAKTAPAAQASLYQQLRGHLAALKCTTPPRRCPPSWTPRPPRA
jgi:hypothetical protein